MLRHNLTLVDMIRQGLGVLMVAINQGIMTQQVILGVVGGSPVISRLYYIMFSSQVTCSNHPVLRALLNIDMVNDI